MSFRTSHYKNKEIFKKQRAKYNKKYYAKTAIYKPSKWTLKEIEMLFDSNITDTELSEKIHRSVAAIQTKRSKILRKESA